MRESAMGQKADVILSAAQGCLEPGTEIRDAG
jgi:hypothetical protein